MRVSKVYMKSTQVLPGTQVQPTDDYSKGPDTIIYRFACPGPGASTEVAHLLTYLHTYQPESDDTVTTPWDSELSHESWDCLSASLSTQPKGNQWLLVPHLAISHSHSSWQMLSRKTQGRFDRSHIFHAPSSSSWGCQVLAAHLAPPAVTPNSTHWNYEYPTHTEKQNSYGVLQTEWLCVWPLPWINLQVSTAKL